MLADYGKLHVSGAGYTVLRPDSVDAATRGWRTALAEGRALRVRGSGHGLSGATLPRTGEMQVGGGPSQMRAARLRTRPEVKSGPK